MQKIIPCLWFDNQAEEAANFYTSIFKISKIGNITRYGIRRLVANRAHCFGRDVARQGLKEIGKSYESISSNEKD